MTTLAVATADRPKVDVGALAGAIFYDTASAIADTVALGINWAEESGHGLNESQKVELLRSALLATSTLEATIAAKLVDDLERAGVETWGLPSNLERLFSVRRDADQEEALGSIAATNAELDDLRVRVESVAPTPRPTLTPVSPEGGDDA